MSESAVVSDEGVDVINGGGAADPQKQTCFLVTPIGDEGSDIRKRSDQVRRYIVGDALEPLGYTLSRADLVNTSGDITEQIVNALLNAELVIADLTDHNPNVFYELALRHAFGKPFIHIIRKGERIPFDIAQQRTVFYDLTDPDSVHTAKLQVREAAREILSGGEEYKVVSPVTRTVDLDQLRRSDDPEQVAMADIQDSLTAIQKQLSTNRLNTRTPTGTFSPDQLGTIRALLVSMAQDDRLNRQDLAVLEAAPATATWEGFIKTLRANMDPFSRPPKTTDDPWGSGPASGSFNGADEEPPF